MGVKEFIQIEGIGEIQSEIKELNYELLNAMNQTNLIKDLFAEKQAIMGHAKDISSMLIPEVRELSAFVNGEEHYSNIAQPKRSRGRPKKVHINTPNTIGRGRPRKPKSMVKAAPKLPKALKMPKELELNLPKELRPIKRSRGRPKKSVAKPVLEVAARLNPLEELRRNLAKLRDE